MTRGFALLLAVSATFGCQGTSVDVLVTPPDAGDDGSICSTGISGELDGGKGAHGGTWPTYAHDMQRTSRADGPGQMRAPEIAWTQRMGGVLGSREATVADVDGDGRPNVVAITGGRATATNPDGSTLWQGPLVGAFSSAGVWNLDGVGSPEAVIDTPTGLIVLDGADGHVLTLLPQTISSTVTFVPVGPAGGILIVGTGGQLSGYDFRGGTHVTTPLWTVMGEAETEVVPGDVDGDGITDLVRPRNAGFDVLDVLTGQAEYTEDPIGPAAYYYVFQLANVDGNPGEEIVAVDTSYQYSPSCGIYVLGVRGGVLQTLWSSTEEPVLALGADFYTVSGAVADLDGDGSLEAVYSQWDGATQTWSTLIVDAASGAAIATLSGQLVQALADLDGDGRVEIAVRSNPLADRSPARSDLRVYDLDSRTAPPTARSWVLPLAHVMMQSGAVQTREGEPDTPVIAGFDPGAGVELLIGEDTAQRQADSTLAVVRGGDGSLASTYSVPVGVIPSVLGSTNDLTSATSQNDVIEFGNDGVAHELTATLTESASFPTGSYENWLNVYALGSSRTMLAMATSNLELDWLDGTHLHADGTPYRLVQVPSVVDTSSLAGGGVPSDPLTYLEGTAPTLVAYQQGETLVTMVGFDTSGVESWQTPLASGAQVLSPGSYAHDYTGDGQADLVVPVLNINSLESLAIFDGATGGVVRSTPLLTILAGADDTTTGSLVDVNGDGIPDLTTPLHSIGDVAINLATDPMTPIWTIPYDPSAPRLNGTVAAVPVDAQGTSLMRFNGNSGYGQYARYSLAGSVVASQDEGLAIAGGADTNGVAFVERTPGAGVFDMVSAGTGGPGLSRLRRIAGDTLATVWTEYFVGGQLLSAPPTAPVALRDPIAVDVDDDGTDEVLFGSDDGWLYAVHSSDGSLAFTLYLGAPVTHVIAGDIDLDPAVELEVALGDGRLVAIDQPGAYTAIRDETDGGGDAAPCGTSGGIPFEPVHASCACHVGATPEGGGANAMATLAAAGAIAVCRRRGRGRRGLR